MKNIAVFALGLVFSCLLMIGFQQPYFKWVDSGGLSALSQAINHEFLNRVGLFFVWDDARATTLDLALLNQLVKQPGRYLIYADQCALGEDFMRRHGIVYKKIPRDITRL